MIKTGLLAAPALTTALWITAAGVRAQSLNSPPDAARLTPEPAVSSDARHSWSSSADGMDAPALPAEPAAAEPGAGKSQPGSAPDMFEGWPPLSRMSVGSGIDIIGFNLRGAVLLTRYFDARLDASLFSYSPTFQVNGFDVNAQFRLNSVGARLDWYPSNSVWRISPGVMLYNGNQFTGVVLTDPGTSFDLNGRTYYSADPNKISGATPVSGTAILGFNRNKAAFTLTGGFGHFIPRSHRHWSFPTELGVAFTGAPTLDVKLSGWVCNDKAELRCSDLSDPNNPVAIQFNQNLNTALTRWRNDLSPIKLYPILSAGVMYSFDLR